MSGLRNQLQHIFRVASLAPPQFHPLCILFPPALCLAEPQLQALAFGSASLFGLGLGVGVSLSTSAPGRPFLTLTFFSSPQPHRRPCSSTNTKPATTTLDHFQTVDLTGDLHSGLGRPFLTLLPSNNSLSEHLPNHSPTGCPLDC